MSHLGRRGFTLIELMIALVLLGLVSTAVYRVMVSHQRVYQAQTQRIDLQQNIRAAATILPAEFRVLDASDGDILSMTADSITIRAMRLFAVACDTPILTLNGPLGAKTVVLRNSMTYGSRMLTIGDSLFLYYEGVPGNRNDDGWVRGRVTAVPVVATCMGPEALPGRAGMRVTFDLGAFVAPQQNKPGVIPMGAPVWGYEIDTYMRYLATDGNWYIGQRIGNAGTVQPLVGPVLAANGMALSYYDAAGGVTAVPANVAQIEVRVRGLTAQPVRLVDGTQARQVDSVVTRVTLRNNKRW